LPSEDAQQADPLFLRDLNLAQPRLGAEVIYATDDFFAPKERLIEPTKPIFIDGKYDDHGKWMDGWETRRRREGDFDRCVLRLGQPTVVRGVDIDTAHFNGNHPEAASIDACDAAEPPDSDSAWWQLVPRMPLSGNCHHAVEILEERPCSLLRLTIFPDGGVARLRVFGEVVCDWASRDPSEVVDLASVSNGGRALLCSDEHFGSRHNLLMPGRGVDMGDGWETRRRRGPGHDWVIVRLGHPGLVERIEIDTAHFKGNYPDRCSVQAASIAAEEDVDFARESGSWPELLGVEKLEADSEHAFEEGVRAAGIVSHVRLNIFPDGGISRLRLFGRVAHAP